MFIVNYSERKESLMALNNVFKEVRWYKSWIFWLLLITVCVLAWFFWSNSKEHAPEQLTAVVTPAVPVQTGATDMAVIMAQLADVKAELAAIKECACKKAPAKKAAGKAKAKPAPAVVKHAPKPAPAPVVRQPAQKFVIPIVPLPSVTGCAGCTSPKP